MLYTIYKVTHLESGKTYIGKHQTLDLNDRYMGSGQLIRRAIKKHGIENFEKEVLYVFGNELEMNEKEKELVTEEFCLRENTFNLCSGGQGGWGYVNKNNLNRQTLSAAAKKRQSENNSIAAKARMRTQDGITQFQEFQKLSTKRCKEKYPNGIWAGKTHSEKSKIRMAASHQGKHAGSKNSQFGTMWVTDGKKSMKIARNSIIPTGFVNGRTITLSK